MSKTND